MGLTIPVNLDGGDAVNGMRPPRRRRRTMSDQLNSQIVWLRRAARQVPHHARRARRRPRGFGAGRVSADRIPAQKDLGADSVFFWPQLIAEKRFGSIGAVQARRQRGLSRLTPRATRQFNQIDGGPRFEYGNRVTGGFGVALRILEPVDLVADTYATQLLGGSGDRGLKPSNEVIGGIKVFVERNSYLMLGARRALPPTASRRRISARSSASSSSRRSATATATAYKDDVDKCPDDPEDFDGFQDEDGCPDPDNDNDGILDKDDTLPERPREHERRSRTTTAAPRASTAIATATASPTPRTSAPTIRRTRDGFQDADGCPDPDNDQDGIPDKKDSCPNDPEDKDGFQDEDGCPDPDNDKDGILDVDDKCPNEPETFNGYQDRGRLPRQGQRHHPGQQHPHPEEDPVQDGQRRDPAGVERHPRRGRHDGHPPPGVHAPRGARARRRAFHRRLQLAPHARIARTRWSRRSLQRGVPRDHLRSQGYGEYCPLDRGAQRGGLGEEPPRRVQGREDARRRHRRRARMQASSRQGRDPGCGAVKRLAIGLAALCSAVVSCGSKGSVAVSTYLGSPQVAIIQASALGSVAQRGLCASSRARCVRPERHRRHAPELQPGQGRPIRRRCSSSKMTSSPLPPFHLDPGAKSDVAFTITHQAGGSMQLISPTRTHDHLRCQDRADCGLASPTPPAITPPPSRHRVVRRDGLSVALATWGRCSETIRRGSPRRTCGRSRRCGA